MLLTRLFKYVISESPEFSNDRYFLCDRVMYPLTAQQERNTRKDYGMRRGRPSTSSSSAFGQPSSSPAIDDDNDGNNEGTCVQSLIPPLILSIRCQMTFLKSFPIYPTLTQTWKPSLLVKPKSSTVKSNCEMSNVVE
ncbi:hypothetical protein Tco_1063632 [Tanacetum coccineum]